MHVSTHSSSQRGTTFLPWLSTLLWKERSALAAYSVAIMLAALFVGHLYPVSFLLGAGRFFEEGDASQHVSGWLFYARDGWHFPLLHTERLNYPSGISIVFTDSIPLAALLFKTIAGWLPPHFHYIGLWQALSFITQALAATFLIRALGRRHALAAVAASLFALCWPTLLWRVGHTSLMTHSLILCSLALYVLGRKREWSGTRTSLAFLLVTLAALTIHPYFLALCYPLFLAFLVDQAMHGEGWKKQWPRLLISIAAVGATGAVLGYFGNGTTTSGFGFYSLNLLSPFWGGRLHPQIIDATGGQHEGFSYFGAGVFVLLPFALAHAWPQIRTLHRRCPALMLVLALFMIYALSTQVYVGSFKLLSYSLPSFLDKLTGTFRVSARFFWVIGYVVLFGSLAALLKKTSWRYVLLLATAMSLQWADTQLLRDQLKRTVSQPAQNDLSPWKPVIADVKQVRIYPAYACAESDVEIYWFFQRLAAYYGKLIDTGYIARANTDCASNRQAFEQPFHPNQLYLMSTRYLAQPFHLPAGFKNAIERGECATWHYAVLCKAGMHRDGWHNTGLPVALLDAHHLSRAEWPAAALKTQVGKLVAGRLVPAQPGAAGYLSYGPYLKLPTGRYRFALQYASHAPAAQLVGKWDVVLGDGVGRLQEVASGALGGTQGAERRIEGSFIVDNSNKLLEIRTLLNGSGDVQVIGVALEKIP